MQACKRCEKTKPADEMVHRAGRVIRLCRLCMGASIKAGHHSREQRMTQKNQPAAEGALALQVQAGLGFNAAVDGEQLVIVQDEDNITLSRSEAYVFFAKFAQWAGLPAATT